MKKILALLLAVLMLCSLAACSKKDDGNGSGDGINVNAGDKSFSDKANGIGTFTYKIYRDGSEAGESSEAIATSKTTLSIPNQLEGVYKIVVTLTDKVGNVFELETDEYIVDLNAPIIKGLNLRQRRCF